MSDPDVKEKTTNPSATSSSGSSAGAQSAAPKGAEADIGDRRSEPASRARPSQPPEDGTRRSRIPLERMVPELIKRGIEKGLEAGLDTLSQTNETLRGVVGEARKELPGAVMNAVEDTKNNIVRVVGREVRDFLSAVDLSKEIQKALTSLTFEVKTEIRFVPNEDGTGVKPEVKTGATTFRSRAEDRGRKRRRERK